MISRLVQIVVLITIIFSCTKSSQTSTSSSALSIDDSLKIGLVLNYPFNGNANDESGNDYNGIIQGATLTADRFGNAGKAYDFGSNAWIKIPKLTKADSLKNFTISVWIKHTGEHIDPNVFLSFPNVDSNSSCSTSFSITNNNGRYSTYHQILTDKAPNVCFYTPAKDSFTTPSSQWSHLVFVQKRINVNSNLFYTQYFQYLNGKKSSKVTTSLKYPLPASFGQGGLIGSDSNSFWQYNFFYGSIDDIRIYNRVLSDNEVLKLYNLH